MKKMAHSSQGNYPCGDYIKIDILLNFQSKFTYFYLKDGNICGILPEYKIIAQVFLLQWGDVQREYSTQLIQWVSKVVTVTWSWQLLCIIFICNCIKLSNSGHQHKFWEFIMSIEASTLVILYGMTILSE